MAAKKVASKAAKPKPPPPPPDTTLGALGGGPAVADGTRDSKLIGDMDYRYEDILQQMVDLQWWLVEKSTYLAAYQNPGMPPLTDAIVATDKASDDWDPGRSANERRRHYFMDRKAWGKDNLPEFRTNFVSKSGHPLDGNPLPHYLDDQLIGPGHPGRVNCTGSTWASTRLEIQRKYKLWQARNPDPARPAGAPPLTFVDVYEHKKALLPTSTAHKNWLRSLPTGNGGDGAPAGVVLAKVGFTVPDAADMRRGDVTQTYPEDGGHGVFVWDRRLVSAAGGPSVDYQQLSSQHHFTDGIGVNGVFNDAERAKAFADWAQEDAKNKAAGQGARREAAYAKHSGGTWDPIPLAYQLRATNVSDSWKHQKELKKGVGRYYRLFPYWPIAIGSRVISGAAFGEGGPSSFEQGGELVKPPPKSGGMAPFDAGARMYDLCEGRAPGKSAAEIDGFFPISTNRTWHGGVHLPTSGSQPVYAMSDGVIIAARMASKGSGSPSNSFVLIRHQVDLSDGSDDVFFCLYMHLDSSKEGSELLKSRWLWQLRVSNDATSKALNEKLEKGEVVALAHPVAAGDIVGHAGGPDHPALHWEVFSKDPIGDKAWTQLKDPGADLFIDLEATAVKPIVGGMAVFTPGPAGVDLVLTAKEVRAMYSGTGNDETRASLRNVICQHTSEWSVDIDWSKLDSTPRFKGLAAGVKAEAKRLAWWDATLDAHGNGALPAGRVVWTYHPVTFSLWLANLVGANPVGKQRVQDVKRFIPTVLTKAGAAKAKDEPVDPNKLDGRYRKWTVAGGGSLPVFDKPEATVPTGLTVTGAFLGKEIQESGGRKLVHLDAWASTGPNGDWVKKPGKKGKPAVVGCFSVKGQTFGKVADGCKVSGPMPEAHEANEKGYWFVRISGWVCFSGSPSASPGAVVAD